MFTKKNSFMDYHAIPFFAFSIFIFSRFQIFNRFLIVFLLLQNLKIYKNKHKRKKEQVFFGINLENYKELIKNL